MDVQGLPASVTSFISDMQQRENQQLMYFISNTPKAGKLTLIWRTPFQGQSMHPALRTPWRKYKSPSQQRRDSTRFHKYKQSWRKPSSSSLPPLQQQSPGLSPDIADTPTQPKNHPLLRTE